MDKQARSEARNQVVVKSNDLIQKTKFDLTLQQQVIISYLISKIQPEDEALKVYEFSVQEFCEVCGIDRTSGKNYDSVKKAIKEIADKSRWIKLEDGDSALFRWIESAKIKENSGTIQIRLNEELKPYLIKQQMIGHYTQYKFIFTLSFKSKYAFRLYELVKSIHYKDLYSYEKKYTLEELKILMGVEDNYKTFSAFRERVLQPAINEINQYTDKIVSYETKCGKGKKVSDIILKVSSKSTLDISMIEIDLEEKLNEANPIEEDNIVSERWL